VVCATDRSDRGVAVRCVSAVYTLQLEVHTRCRSRYGPCHTRASPPQSVDSGALDSGTVVLRPRAGTRRRDDTTTSNTGPPHDLMTSSMCSVY